jgi:hypothetical protein
VGLKLLADEGGAVAYSSFYDVRVRNAKIGIHIVATGVGSSFANSNSFYRGAVSGGGFDYCLLLEGPGMHIQPIIILLIALLHSYSVIKLMSCMIGANNNNVFYGTVFEPYMSNHAHIQLSGTMTQMIGQQIRVEALSQPADRPMIYLAPETHGSSLSGLFSGGYVNANRMAHQLDIKTGKFVGASPSNRNEFQNSAFRNILAGPVSAGIPQWTATATPSTAGAKMNVSVSNQYQILEGHNVLKLQLPALSALKLKPSEHPQPKLAGMYRGVSFGMYVRYISVPADKANSQIYATYDTSITDVTSSLVHPAASTEWHFVSMRGDIPYTAAPTTAVAIFTEFVFQNLSPTSSLDIEITLPSFSWGEESLQIESAPVLQSGGKMFGALTTGLVKNILPPGGSNPNYYVFPKDGNVFVISSTSVIYPAISRLNHLTADRFPEGTVITILFLVSGVSITDSAYINTFSGFTSNSHCSITLLAREAGTWVELSRSGI